VGYCDFTEAELRALTRQRRREAIERRIAAAPPTIRVSARHPTAEFSLAHVRWADPAKRVLRSIRRHVEKEVIKARRAVVVRYRKPGSRDHGIMPTRVFRTYWRIQGGLCYLCAKPFKEEDWATRDHVIPRALGGSDERNILLACGACNNRKADRPPKPCEMIYLAAANAGFMRAFECVETEAA
jgi:5-methylcytosine-specific restriction endonuclease McrA